MFTRALRFFFIGLLSLFATTVTAQATPPHKEDLSLLFSRIGEYSCEEVADFVQRGFPKPNTELTGVVRHQRLLLEAYMFLSRCALNTKPTTELLEGQLRGMVEALGDSHARFYNESEYREEILERSRGVYSGVGIVIVPEELGNLSEDYTRIVRVKDVFPESPAEKFGIQVGDMILAVDGRDIVSFKDHDAVISAVTGPRNTTVRLRIRRGAGNPYEIIVMRGEVKIENVKVVTLPNTWIHITLKSFSGEWVDGPRGATMSSCRDMERLARREMQKNSDFGGVVLDLRDNPGGLLDIAGCVFALFAPRQFESMDILSIRDRAGIRPYLRIKPVGTFLEKPIVVLVNEESASASELVAKLIQYHKIGVIAGSLTYGKGSVQEIRPLYDRKIGIKYTTAEYMIGPPNAPVAVQCVGVTPDILLRHAQLALEENKSERECQTRGTFTGTSAATDIVPRDIKKENPVLYRRIVEMLAQEPFKLVPKE